MTSYSCNLYGECEVDPLGRYPSLSLCQSECVREATTARDRENIFLSINQNPIEAFSLAPSDLLQYIQRAYQLDLQDRHLSRPSGILALLVSKNYLTLFRLRYEDYVRGVADSLDLLLVETIAPLLEVRDIYLPTLKLKVVAMILNSSEPELAVETQIRQDLVGVAGRSVPDLDRSLSQALETYLETVIQQVMDGEISGAF